MERYDSTMRAARYLFGAGTIAVAMVATTAGAASAQTAETLECPYQEGGPALCGKTFEDADSNGVKAANEGNIGGSDVVVVAIKTGGGVYTADVAPCEEEFPDSCGFYSFAVPPGTYTVCVPKVGQSLNSCTNNPSKVTVVVPEGSGSTQAGVWQDVGRPGADVVSDNGPGTGTPGYWKNHAWPVDSILIGHKTYTRTAALGYMGKVGGDKSVTIFSSLVSAKLNVIILNPDSCVKDAIAAADQWFIDNVPNGMYGKIAGSNPVWSGDDQGDEIHQQLDMYNNGLLPCAHHRN